MRVEVEAAFLEELLGLALDKGGDYADIYIETRQNSSIWCEDNRLERIHSGAESGVGIRVVKGQQTAYVYTNDMDPSAFRQAARTAGQAINYTNTDSPLLNLRPQATPKSPTGALSPQAMGWDDKIERVLQANQIAWSTGPEIRQVSVGIADVQKQIIIANSCGELLEDKFSRVRGVVNVVAGRNGILQTGYESLGGVCGWELFMQASWQEQARQAAKLAIDMLSARPAPAGRMPVIMSAKAGGTMVHEACGHGLEADLVHKGLSVYRGRQGQVVASPLVSVIDDATLPGRYGSFVFDDEGIIAQNSVLIEKGRLVGYLYDRLTAKEDKTESTGNGRRESYQHKPMPRMSNTFIKPGEDDPEEIIRSTKRGLLVLKMGGGQVNTINGDFVFEVSEAYMIENGQVSYPVRGATLSGNGPQALQDIDRVGSDLGFAIGVCGKNGQGVPVSDAQPTIRIKELTVGGTMVGAATAEKGVG